MLFNDYLYHTYIVEEISPEQAKYLLAQQILEKPEFYESIDFFLEKNYSYRTSGNNNKAASL